MAAKKCIVPGCKKPFLARLCCMGHYRKAVREGLVAALIGKNEKSKQKAIAKLQFDGRATRWE